MAGRSRSPSSNTHTHTAQPNQGWGGTSEARKRTHTPEPPSHEWRGAAETRAQAHTPTPHIPARSGGVQAERPYKHTHPPIPKSRVAGRSPKLGQSTHTHTANPSQEWQGNSGARTQAQTHTRTPVAGGKPKPEPEHTHLHRAPHPGVSGYQRSAHTSRHTPQHPSQEWRGTAETRAQAHTPEPHTPARSGGVQAERAHKHTHTPTPQAGLAGRSGNPSPSTHTHTAHPSQESPGTTAARTQARTHPNTPARSGGAQPKPEPKHTHPHRTPQPGVAGYKRSAHTSTDTLQHPSQERQGTAETRAQAQTPTPHTSARYGGVQAKGAHKHTYSPKHQPGVAGRSRKPSPSTTQTQTQAPCISRKPSPHSTGTEAARAMQVTRPNKNLRPGVRLHPGACGALGLEAERVTCKRLGTPVPRTYMHALRTGCARKSGEPIGLGPKEGTCASTGVHRPGMTSTSRWRQSALPVLPGAALLGATSQV